MLPGLCIDLETTIAGRIPDKVRPAGKKRYETRIIEIGAVLWHKPEITFTCLVNPFCRNKIIKSVVDLRSELSKMHQKPDNTIDFWSRVLVKRNSVTKNMLKMDPKIWLKQSTDKRAEAFVRWHNDPCNSPTFLSEQIAFQQLCAFSEKHNVNVWYAHNGNSFDFKVLQGCALRTKIPIPPHIQQIDTLRHFRRIVPHYLHILNPYFIKQFLKQHTMHMLPLTMQQHWRNFANGQCQNKINNSRL